MTTKYDETLSHLLLPSLINYENERVTGQTFGTEEF